jgi:hypothetical protein
MKAVFANDVPGMSYTTDELSARRERARLAPFRILLMRDGRPPVLLCADTEGEARSMIPPSRSGPNGPLDYWEFV